MSGTSARTVKPLGGLAGLLSTSLSSRVAGFLYTEDQGSRRVKAEAARPFKGLDHPCPTSTGTASFPLHSTGKNKSQVSPD